MFQQNREQIQEKIERENIRASIWLRASHSGSSYQDQHRGFCAEKK